MTAGNRCDVAEEMVAYPLGDDGIVAGEDQGVFGRLLKPKGFDPRSIIFGAQQLLEVWLKLSPTVHRLRLAQNPPRGAGDQS